VKGERVLSGKFYAGLQGKLNNAWEASAFHSFHLMTTATTG
jgi:hypothetical protein